MRAVALFLLGSLALGSVATPGLARAGDGERAASIGAGYATYATPDAKDEKTIAPSVGAAIAGSFERGVGDEVAVRADVVVAGYLGGGTAATGLATIGLGYRVDILKYVPYVDVSVGVLVRTGGPFSLGVEPALRIGGGIDLLRSRSRSVGAALALTSFASATTTLTITVRSTWRWGYF